VNRTFYALTTTASVTVDDDVPGHALVDMLLARYPDSHEQPELSFHLRGGSRPSLVRAGAYETPVEASEDLVPLFELDLYHALIEAAKPGWLLHAAALERDGRAIVFAGPSGAGKTTLSIALIARGWRTLTEEIVLVDRQGFAHGLARPIHGSSGVIPRQWRQLDYVMRSSSGRVHGLLAHPPSESWQPASLPVHALARIEHGIDREPVATVVPAHVALRRLWECTLRCDDDGVSAAPAILGAHRAFELASSSVDEAVRLAEQIASS